MDLPTNLELCGRLALAIVLGGIIGMEREVNDHPAGLRTHITVAVGSALFVIAGAYGFDEFMTGRRTTVTVGVDRVASTVVTGIGFLGGGAILKHGATVRGLTTAGSLWVVAAIGLAVGLGSYVVAVFATAATLLTLVGLKGPERWLELRRRADDTVQVHLVTGAEPGPVVAALAQMDGVSLTSVSVRDHEGHLVVTAQLEAGIGLDRVVDAIGRRDDVESAGPA